MAYTRTSTIWFSSIPRSITGAVSHQVPRTELVSSNTGVSDTVLVGVARGCVSGERNTRQ